MKTFRRLSAPGSSALSIWQIQGPETDCALLFGKHVPPSQNDFRLDAKSLPFDEALLWRRSNAGSPVHLECHLHGGYGVAAAFREWMAERGWKEVENAELEKFDRDLWHANSPLAARVLAMHRGGAFEKELERIKVLRGKTQRAAIDSISKWNAWAEVLEQPPSIVLAGPPNVGKSTLFNIWNRAALATIQDGHGTTRDAVEVALSLGAPGEEALFTLTDTAGLGEGLSELDHLAMQFAWEKIDAAWKVVWVLDTALKPSPSVLKRLQNRTSKDLILLNRIDLQAEWTPSSVGIKPDLSGSQSHVTTLIAELEAKLLQHLGPPPPPSTLLAVQQAQREALQELLHGLG